MTTRFFTPHVLGVVASLLFTASGWAAIGDNAPPVPSTYNTSHPRLPHPDQAFLAGLAANSTALARYNAAADAWNSNDPGGFLELRRLVIAYMANKIANPTKAATYFAKIKSLMDLGGTWGTLLYAVNDGVSNGTYTLTAASANFLTGCGGASCQGQILSIDARTYTISSIPSPNTVVLSASNPPPNGSNLKIRVFSTLLFANLNLALIYDWLYHDLDTETRAEFLKQLEVLCTLWEESYIGVGASPYNDVFYIRLGTFGLIGALAIYPDHPNSTKHMRFMTDVWFNYLLPVWKQVFGPEGGGWHEGWPDYVNGTNNGMTAFIVPSLLSWQAATGDPIFTRESWLKNFAYFTIYVTKPDLVVERIGDSSRPYLTGEYDLRIGAKLGSLNGLAEIYNDPVLRGWARFLNKEFPSGPDGYEPAAWPFYKPDNNSNAVAPLSALPITHNFTGWGVLSMRTGWTEDDSFATLKYGANFWSHEHFDTGAFTLFSRGNLAVDSGSYRAGSASKHQNQYGRQTIAHNSLTITDPADVYPTTFWTVDENGQSVYLAPPNDGGQRRIGTGYNLRFPQFVSPFILGDWLRNWEYYHTGKMVALATTPNYTYTAVDITAAYNNRFSITEPNATNRTRRVSKAVRHMLFVPRGTAAYVVVFDQVVSTNATFVKRWLLHSINQPAVTGNKFVVVRDELITPKPYSDLWPGMFSDYLKYDSGSGATSRYKYDGKLYGWMVQPQAGQIAVIGGPGKEFWIEDPLNPGTGTNWNQCMKGQCATNEGMGSIEDFINPESNTAPQEPGSWRIEQKPASAATDDVFLNVMLATNTSDSNVPVDVTIPAGLPNGVVGATWSDNNRRYTVRFPRDGIGGHITIEGGIDEELLSQAKQLPDYLEIVSGTGQSAPANSAAANPLTVLVKDNAGNGVPNATVHFGVTKGNGWLTTDRTKTDASGRASAILTLGPGTTGAVTNVMAYVNGLAPVEFVATISQSSETMPVVSLLTCTPTILNSSGISSCTVTLSQVAGPSGASVTLSSSASTLAVSSTVTVSAGSTSTSFNATASAISSTQSATVTATLNGVSKTASLTLQAVGGIPALISLSCSPTGINSGVTATCTATLSQPAGSGGATITLVSSSIALKVPASIVVAAGATSTSFTALASVDSNSQSVIVTASFDGVTKTTTVTVIPLTQPTGGTSIPLNNWTMVPTRGFPVQTVGYEKLVYAPSPVKKAVMLGNYQQLGTEPNQGLIAYDFETNSWSVLDIGESFHSESMPEAGHPVGGLAYNPNQKTLIYYCCASGSNQAENLYDTWWFDFFGQTGRSKRSWPKPGAVLAQSSAFDALNNTYVLHGGGSFVGTWTYNPLTNAYQQQTAKGTPPNPSVGHPAMAYNTTDHQVYLFGGQVGAGYSNDLFKYDVATNTWTKLNPSGSAPSPRWRGGFAYDSANDVFLVYGGEDASQVYNDSWIYSPNTNAWTQLNPAQSPPFDSAGPFETLAYDSDHNVFVLVLRGSGGYANGPALSHAAQTWLFRYQGAGPNAGTQDSSFQPTPGAINRNADAWAKDPSLVASGDKLYAAWVETGKPFERANAAWFHVYAKKRQNEQWDVMGGSSTSLDSEFNNYSESHSPSIALVAGKPWISWYKWNNSGQTWALWAKSWDGSAWQGGLVGRVGSDAARAFQGRSQMADVNGVPHVAFLEVDKTFFPQRTFAYVKSWVDGQWALKGAESLNANPTVNSTASSISIASDGGDVYVAWTEYTSDNLVKTHTQAQAYVARWNGAQWARVGDSINVNANAWADDVSIACLNGQPYVAWTERTIAGETQLFVKTLQGGSWVLLTPSSMNKDSLTGWAFRPSLVADVASGSLYLAWTEQQALGQRSQTYVSKFRGGIWTALGDSLNADPALGSAKRVSVAVVGGQPVAAWGEVNFGSLRQVFAKQWNGSNWTLLNDTPPQPSCDLNGDGAVNIQDVQAAINQGLGVAPCNTANLQQNGRCSVVDVQRVINASLGGRCVIGQ